MGLLDKVGEAVAKAVGGLAVMPDPEAFDDPLALRVEWKPLTPGGSNFRTHKLVEASGTLRFAPTVGMKLFSLAFFVPGLVMLGISPFALFPWSLLFGGAFTAAGMYLLWPRKKDFDLEAKQVALGGTLTPFGGVHALQLIRERVSGDESADYWSYELNLVLKDGTRLNVVDHSNLPTLREEADRVARAIGCKVWDGIAAPQITLAQLMEKAKRGELPKGF